MKFTELLDQWQVSYRQAGETHHATTGWVQLDCPLCGKGSNKWHLGYKLDGRYFSCWRCGRLPLGETLAEITGLSVRECLRMVLGETTPEAYQKSLISGKLTLPKNLGPLLPAHRKYLHHRGFNPDEITKLWELQGIGVSSKLAWRLFIPILNNGKLVSWTTRSISDTTPARYINAPVEHEAVSMKVLLYGSQYPRHSVIVVEGPTDVWKIGPGSVATMGIGFTRAQLLAISRYPSRCICFDSEPDAQKRAQMLCQALEVFDGETTNVVLAAKDPGSASPRELRKLRKRFLL